MQLLVAGFWGAFFGAAALLLAGAVAAFAQHLRRVALIAAVAALMPAMFAVAFLGLFGEVNARVLAHVSVVTACVLALSMLALLGFMRRPGAALRLRLGMTAMGLSVLGAGWLLDGPLALALASVASLAVGALVFVACLRRARRRDRLALLSLLGIVCIVSTLSSLCWIALHHAAPAPVHMAAATSGVLFYAVIAVALWQRYSYLLELRQALAYGPSYDPVTRMRSHRDTGHMVGMAFHAAAGAEPHPLGVIVISIGNLEALRKLHGQRAMQHALFVLGGRLRRHLPADLDAGRLGDDGFLLLSKEPGSGRRLAKLAQSLAEQLSRPVSLSTGDAAADADVALTDWAAMVGIGFMVTRPGDRPSFAVDRARAMSRAAWSQPGRVAGQDALGEVAGDPQLASV